MNIEPCGDNLPEYEFHEDGTATVVRQSPFSGKWHKATLRMTQPQSHSWLDDGMLIQNVFPHLTADEREFLITGITPAEWEEAFGE